MSREPPKVDGLSPVYPACFPIDIYGFPHHIPSFDEWVDLKDTWYRLDKQVVRSSQIHAPFFSEVSDRQQGSCNYVKSVGSMVTVI